MSILYWIQTMIVIGLLSKKGNKKKFSVGQSSITPTIPTQRIIIL